MESLGRINVLIHEIENDSKINKDSDSQDIVMRLQKLKDYLNEKINFENREL